MTDSTPEWDQSSLNNRWLDALVLAAGCVFALAFAPLSWYPLAILAVAVVFYVWRDAGPWRAAWVGFLFGVGSFAVGVSWVYVSLREYGGMPPSLAVAVVIAFVFLLALFPAAAGWLQARVGMRLPVIVRLAVLMPVAWTLTEWLRGWVLSGFPWLSLGYAQIDTPLAAIAPWVGVHGVSLIAAIVAGALVGALAPRWTTRAIAIGAAGVALLVGYAAGQAVWSEPDGEPMTVALVQGNVALVDKWSPAQRERIIADYLELSSDHEDVDLVVWPEAAMPLFVDELPEAFWDWLQDHPADFLFGSLERATSVDGPVYYNSVVAVATGTQLYRKRHLVPFGEYVPFPRITRRVMDYLVIPWSNLSPWKGPQAPIVVAGRTVGVSICYEDAFPNEVRRALPGATLLANVSEDAWFGNSLAPHQRLEMARMRALETARPMLRAANTGVSALIDADGAVSATTDQFVQTVLRGTVQPVRGTTPYVSYGNTPMVTLLLLLLAAGFFWSLRSART